MEIISNESDSCDHLSREKTSGRITLVEPPSHHNMGGDQPSWLKPLTTHRHSPSLTSSFVMAQEDVPLLPAPGPRISPTRPNCYSHSNDQGSKNWNTSGYEIRHCQSNMTARDPASSEDQKSDSCVSDIVPITWRVPCCCHTAVVLNATDQTC